MKLVSIAVGGIIGALLRYGVSISVYRFNQDIFPWGTLAVNLSGSFAIGGLWALSERLIMPQLFRPFVMIGILGAYTTFSSFALETFNLAREKEMGLALMNVLANNVGGLVLVYAGFVAAKFIMGRFL